MAKRRSKMGYTYKDRTNGYFVECVRGHRLFPKKKFVYQHRRVMAEDLNRKLSKFEIVHHKNHDGYDNRIENLEILDRREHAKIHHEGKRRSLRVRLKMSISAKKRCTIEWKKAVSKRVTQQHKDGKFGRQTWRAKK